MNNLLNTNETFFDRLASLPRLFSNDNSDIALTDLLLISRVLFAVVMVGFIGYYFDRLKDALIPVKSDVKVGDHRRH